uniref:TonB-dependent receptor plug domain-containing protein n=1 Tax=Phenylobacterium glaciei TaxID=2803784 RepID=A0A974SB76_9CAUL|nr:TonB-dependent receptor plug domain-containing protein [Phenylobacterium glaciei]
MALCLGLGGLSPSAARAQTAEVGEVVVTGFRASLASAIEIKKRETALVDVINAEDIADFPDLNLAEALQRIPGVAIDRDGGEGRSITVRGLSGTSAASG